MSYVTAVLLSLAGSTITCWSLLRGDALRQEEEPFAIRIGPIALVGLFLTFVAGAVGLADVAGTKAAVPILDYGALGLQWLGFGSLLAAFAWGPRFQGNETTGRKITLWGGLGLGLIGAAQLCGLVSGRAGVELQQLRDYAGFGANLLDWLAVALMVLGTASMAGVMRLSSWLREGEGMLLQRTNLAVRVAFGLLGLALVIVALLNVLAPTPAIFLSFLLLSFGLAATVFGSYLDGGQQTTPHAPRKWASIGLLGLACLVTAADRGALLSTPTGAENERAANLPLTSEQRTKLLAELDLRKQLQNRTEADLLQSRVGQPAPAPTSFNGTPETYDMASYGHRGPGTPVSGASSRLEQLERNDVENRERIAQLETLLKNNPKSLSPAANEPSNVYHAGWNKAPLTASNAPAGDPSELQDRIRPRR